MSEPNTSGQGESHHDVVFAGRRVQEPGQLLKDTRVAQDTEGRAGKVAALLSVTLGTDALGNRTLAGEGLVALDFGMGVQAVGEVAMCLVPARQGHTATAQETVQWRWTKATGGADSDDRLRPCVPPLHGAQISTGDLVNVAMQHALAHPSAQRVGVLDSGQAYTL